jgi:amidase
MARPVAVISAGSGYTARMSYLDDARVQADRQQVLLRFRRHAPLNFAPFDAELRESERHAKKVALLVQDATIFDLRQRLANGELTSMALILHYLRRIKRHTRLNALIEINPEALTLARAKDRERVRGKARGALHGIPILIKDNIGTGDRMHTTAGAAVLHAARCDRDARLVQNLRAAGAIVLGKANLSEWANYFADRPSPNGFSAIGGQTRNPYGAFDVGGSSSGSAVAVAAGLCAAAIGTETHGSIVYPSLCNSVFGLKPSLGLISRDRIIPITDATDTAGPLARCMADLAMLMDVLIGPDSRDPACVALADDAAGAALLSSGLTPWLQRDGLKGKRIGLAPDGEPGDAYTRAFAKLRAELEEAGATLVDIPKLEPKTPFRDILDYGFIHGVERYLVDTKAPVRSLAEVAAFNASSPARRAPNGMGTLHKALENTWTAAEYAKQVVEARAAARASIDRVMHQRKLDLIATFDPSGYGEVFVMAGAPLLAVPAGYLRDGRPYGFTLASRWLDDGALAAAAATYEQLYRPRRDPDLEALARK